jgi:hypothetical protein
MVWDSVVVNGDGVEPMNSTVRMDVRPSLEFVGRWFLLRLRTRFAHQELWKRTCTWFQDWDEVTALAQREQSTMKAFFINFWHLEKEISWVLVSK